MRKKLYFMLFFILSVLSYSQGINKTSIYEEMGLSQKMDYRTFLEALTGYEKIEANNKNILAIIDYTKPATSKRFFVLDLKNKKIIHESLVSHAKNSGVIETIVFSNTPNSYQSSMGFFITGESYKGSYGYSLRLKGLEPEINSNAELRNIVIHGADYVSEDFIKKNGFLGRTLGCPALPNDEVVGIIETIKDGVILFVAGKDSEYLEKTRIL